MVLSMKKSTAIIVLAVCLVLSWKYVSWHFIPQKPLLAVVLDKTVPAESCREHKGLFWVLNNLRYVNKDTGRPFAFAKDYYGFFPLADKKYTVRQLPEDLNTPGLIYIADTYGVYTADFYGENSRGERSRLIYGGLQRGEVEAIERALSGKNTLIAEFNSFASPTSGEARRRLEYLLAVTWTGWMGRHFENLSLKNTEIPVWMPLNYERQYRSTWTFEGPGFVFVNEDNRLFVLRDGPEAGPGLNRVFFTTEAAKEFGVADGLPYSYWFDVVAAKPKRNAQVLANYKLDVTAQGEKILAANGLSPVFPAIIRTEAPNHTYYLAGDFADYNASPHFYGSRAWSPHLLPRGINTAADFFWKVYFPFMRKALGQLSERQ